MIKYDISDGINLHICQIYIIHAVVVYYTKRHTAIDQIGQFLIVFHPLKVENVGKVWFPI